MVICLENLRDASITESAEDLMNFIDSINSKNLGICLDTGHLNLSDHPSQTHFIRTAWERIKALHISNNEEKYDQHMMPFFRGIVGFVEVIIEMKRLGYDGFYNLEIPGERCASLAIRGYKWNISRKCFACLDEL